jgi:HEPN domain-containing protein
MELEEKIEYWVDNSDYDFKTARSMQRSGRYVYTVIMCQQSIEKLLKAHYLKKHKIEAPKSHNLLYLIEQIAVEISENDKTFLAEVSSFYISGRYPDYKKKVSAMLNRKKAKEYLKKSREFLKWLKTILRK